MKTKSSDFILPRFSSRGASLSSCWDPHMSFSLSASPILQLYIYEQHFEKLLCLPHNTQVFFLAICRYLLKQIQKIPHFFSASPGFALWIVFFYCFKWESSSSRNSRFWLIYNEASSILPVVTTSTYVGSVFTPRLYYFWTRCSVRLEHLGGGYVGHVTKWPT